MMTDTYIHRDIEESLLKYAKQFPAVALSGPRQSGKSTTLRFLFRKTHAYIGLDDPTVRERFLNDPKLFLDRCPENVIFDEIQLLPELIPYLKMKIDADRGVSGRYLLTGSNHFTMIKGLSESLAGRVGLLSLLPFAITEIRPGRKVSPETTFIDSLLTGLYPDLVVKEWADPGDWYASYLQTYIEKDIRLIQNIVNVRDFHRFVGLLAARCSQLLNMSSLAKELGISVPTIRQWLSILEASYIIHLLPPYFSNLGKRIVKSPKIYFQDTGLACYLTGMKTAGHVMNGPFAGALYENYCVSEFLKRNYHLGKKHGLYFWRTRAGSEVDLLVDKGTALSLFEFKLSKTVKPVMAKTLNDFDRDCGFKEVEARTIVTLTGEPTQVTRHVGNRCLLGVLESL